MKYYIHVLSKWYPFVCIFISCQIFNKKGLQGAYDKYVRAYIDNLSIISNGNFEDHLNKVEIVLKKLMTAGSKINAEKSFFARNYLEYLVFKITRQGIMPFTR